MTRTAPPWAALLAGACRADLELIRVETGPTSRTILANGVMTMIVLAAAILLALAVAARLLREPGADARKHEE